MRDALTECEGVEQVTIDFNNKLATARFDESKTDAEKLLKAVRTARDDFAETTVKAN